MRAFIREDAAVVDKFNSRAAFHGCRAGASMQDRLGRQSGGCNGGCENTHNAHGENCGGCCGSARNASKGNCLGGCAGGNLRNSSNGGVANGKNDCKKLMERLKEVEFSLIDTVLYLDAYPYSCEALAYYNKLKAEREEMIKALSMSCNKPMTMFDNYGDAWSWTDAPWPWENCAN